MPRTDDGRQPGTSDEARIRFARWRFFQIIFALTYLGIVLDIATTALGYRQLGPSYEQNPIGAGLIGGFGWAGIFALLTALCALCYVAFRIVYFHGSLRWSWALNKVVLIIMAVRWITVVGAVAFLVGAQ